MYPQGVASMIMMMVILMLVLKLAMLSRAEYQAFCHSMMLLTLLMFLKCIHLLIGIILANTLPIFKDLLFECFSNNFMQENPEIFQFMFLKKYTSEEIVPKFIEIHGTEIKCE